MIEEKVRQKIEELITRSRQLAFISTMARNSVEVSLCETWITEALNIARVVVPTPSNAYREKLEKIAKHHSGQMGQAVKTIAGIFQALLNDIDAGLLGDLRDKISAEIFDDFIDHAEQYRLSGRKNEAGVIAGVVFEDTIRRIYRSKIGSDNDQHLEDLINSLAKQGVITALQSKQAKVASHVRTKATHAK
ncbi:MAG: hypothetical protein ABSG18_23505 [Steroidobacteraceae bacterium]|jgi:hypothetical protein